ncbi:MAG: DUF924 domain-containing protein [Proteobacteria bacterium]|jgi:uncharacterized protein (DUF924 family)|nr:DUF924 family protein [Alphaproteobacteria bacterium]NCC04152.1 DUF924 domain-containing protein [Pseudomonadota bacterium]
MSIDPQEILNYWFYEVGREKWFSNDPALDEDVRKRFQAAYEQAAGDELGVWEETPEGMLALLLLLDTFPLMMFRGTPRAYAMEDTAVDLARHAIIRHFDDRIDRNFKLFFYRPFIHSEKIGNQRLGVFYIRERTKEPDWVDEAEECFQIIHVFGRFPDRNAILGRETTPEEQAFIEERKSQTAAGRT